MRLLCRVRLRASRPGRSASPGCSEAPGGVGSPSPPARLTPLLSPFSPVDFIGGFDSYGYQAPQKTSHLQLQPLYT